MADSSSEDDGQTDRNARALSAGVGALIGLPFGPVGSVAGAALGPLLEPYVSDIMYLIGQAGRRRGAEALAEACEGTDLSVDETLSLIFADERYLLLAATAVFAAMRTTWEGKVPTLGRSLASGLLASDDAEVDTEQLIMLAVADIEAPHLALLDLLVARHPPQTMGEREPVRLDIPEYSYSASMDNTWNAGRRKWSIGQIQHYRPRLAPVFSSLIGTLQRHGLAVFDANSEQAIEQLGEAVYSEAARRDQEQRTGKRQRRPSRVFKVTPRPGTWEPTELGEQVWLRFHKAGADVPDVWLPLATTPQMAESDADTSGA